jgi:DNA adenine methylase
VTTDDRQPPTAAGGEAVPLARPVLKWAGGKGRLLPELLGRIPSTFEVYHEPFIGGGALFFALAGQGRLGRAYLSDANPSLIDVYLALRDCINEIILHIILGSLFSSWVIHRSN